MDIVGLKGAGHFSFWFIIGWLLFVLSVKSGFRGRRWLVMGPFVPYLLAFVGTIPYVFLKFGWVSRKALKDSFFDVVTLYSWLDGNPFANKIFGSFHLSVVLGAGVYLLILHHYLNLLKKSRYSRAK